MRFCTKCGAQLDDSGKYCTKCGAACSPQNAEPQIIAETAPAQQPQSKPANKTLVTVAIALACVAALTLAGLLFYKFVLSDGFFGADAEVSESETEEENEPKQKKDKKTEEDTLQLVGTWIADTTDAAGLDFPDTVTYYGAELYLTDTGKIQFMVGDWRQEGTYEYEDGVITAKVKSSFGTNNSEQTLVLTVTEEDDAVQISMPYADGQLVWNQLSQEQPLLQDWSDVVVLDCYRSDHYTVPVLTYDSADARAINAEIEKEVLSKAKTADNGGAAEFAKINYKTFFSKDKRIVSLVFYLNIDYDAVHHLVYNFDIQTGKQVTNEEILSLANVKQEDFLQIARQSALANYKYENWSYTSDFMYFYFVMKNVSEDNLNRNMQMFLDGETLMLASLFTFDDSGKLYGSLYEAVPLKKADGWSAAYEQFIAYGEFFEDMYGDPAELIGEYSEPLRFILHDTNADGVPELIIQNGCNYEGGATSNVFTFINGKVKHLGNAGWRHGDFQYLPGTNYHGLLWQNGNMGYYPMVYYYEKNGELVEEPVLTEKMDTAEEITITQDTSDDTLFMFGCDNPPEKASYTYSDILNMGWENFVKEAVQ